MSKTTLQERMTLALGRKSGLTQAGLARACGGIARSSVNAWVKGGTESIDGKFLTSAARYLGVDPHWLATGEGEMLSGAGTNEASKPNVTPLVSRARVPLISWVQAGELSEVLDTIYPGEVERWVDVQTVTPTRHTFALVVTGDSMENKQGWSQFDFKPGTVLIVDPDRACGPNDFVIAKDVDTQQANFKQLVHDGGRWYLRPINSQYPTIEIDDPNLRVIGKVIEATPPSMKLI